MATPLRFRLRVVNVPESLPHASRKTELESIPDYVEVESDSVLDNATLMNVGSATPDESRRTFPWMKTDPVGRPLGLFVYYGGTWVRVEPFALGSFPNIATFTGAVASIVAPYKFCDGTNGTPDLRLAMWYMVGSTLTAGTAGSQTTYALGYMMYVGYP